MNAQSVAQVLPTRVGLLFGMFSGWLVFLFAMFLILIVSSVVLRHFDIAVEVGDSMFIVEIIAAAVCSIFLAGVTGRAASNWLKNRTALVSYLWLGIAILLTLLSFPGIFTFSTVQNVQ